jgi:hypothetical protein
VSPVARGTEKLRHVRQAKQLAQIEPVHQLRGDIPHVALERRGLLRHPGSFFGRLPCDERCAQRLNGRLGLTLSWGDADQDDVSALVNPVKRCLKLAKLALLLRPKCVVLKHVAGLDEALNL